MPRFPITWPFLRRRGWLLLLGVIGGGAAAWALSGVTVSATNTYSVSTTGSYQPPYQQERLALTYAQLLPEEPLLVDAVSDATRFSRGYVRDHLSITALPESNILVARFSATSATRAATALRAFTRALSRASDSAGTSLGRTVRPLTGPSTTTGMSRKRGLMLGVLGGLALAFALALTLERRRPRVDDAGDLAAMLWIPVSRVRGSDLPRQAGRGGGASLLPADRALPANVLGGSAGQVLVVERGAALAAVEETLQVGRSFGAPVAAALFVNRGIALGWRR